MINTTAVLTSGYDPTTLIIIICIIAYTVLMGMAGYFIGRDASRLDSDKWWDRHDEHLKELAEARHDRAVEGGFKGHETRKRRDGRVVDRLTGTECDL